MGRFNQFARVMMMAGFCFTAFAGEVPKTFRNPILPGFHPDPSICRVGEDYYMVTSSFEWFPGVPIYHSRDLVNWRQIGNVLARPEQLKLEPGHRHNGGIWAPTIRHFDGTFYMITTCAGQGNFFVTAEDPSGPWSDPVWLKSAPGIDPSLFRDDDGRFWFSGAANIEPRGDWPNQNGVYIQEIDLKAGKLKGKPVQMTHGHALNARWTEAPHIYKIDGRYLLLVAEGGTGKHHCVSVFESDSIQGPYIPGHTNPVLTHRHLGKNYPFGMLGHADLVETQNGEWWAVLLGRRVRDNLSMLARETFLVPVGWEDGWPLFNPGIGRVLETEQRPDLPWHPFPPVPARDEFESVALAPQWNFLRTPFETWHAIQSGRLIMDVRSPKLTELENPSMIVRRIQHYDYTATTRMHFDPESKQSEAGMTAFLDNERHYRLAVKGGRIVLIQVKDGEESVMASADHAGDNVVLQVEAQYFDFVFRYGKDEAHLIPLGDRQDARVITAKQFIGTGFNGPYIGMYASGNGQASKRKAAFDWFEYKPVTQ